MFVKFGHLPLSYFFVGKGLSLSLYWAQLLRPYFTVVSLKVCHDKPILMFGGKARILP